MRRRRMRWSHWRRKLFTGRKPGCPWRMAGSGKRGARDTLRWSSTCKPTRWGWRWEELSMGRFVWVSGSVWRLRPPSPSQGPRPGGGETPGWGSSSNWPWTPSWTGTGSKWLWTTRLGRSRCLDFSKIFLSGTISTEIFIMFWNHNSEYWKNFYFVLLISQIHIDQPMKFKL